jgi:hypothetical protein
VGRICVTMGSASQISAATASLLRRQGFRVIGSDLHDAVVVADLTTTDGRAALVRRVSRLAGGGIEAEVTNASGGPLETSLSLSFFGAVASLEGLRPLLANSPAQRAVAVSSIASLQRTPTEIIERCPENGRAWGKHSGPEGLPVWQTRRQRPTVFRTSHRYHSISAQPLSRPYSVGAEGSRRPKHGGRGHHPQRGGVRLLRNAWRCVRGLQLHLRASMVALTPRHGVFPRRPEEAAALLAGAQARRTRR